MFKKYDLDALYDDLKQAWIQTPEYDRLLRDTHLGIAYSDSGCPLTDIDPVVVSLINKHKPK